MKRTLFVSYSHDGIDRDKLNYLIEQIKKRGRSTVRVLIDLHEVRLGGSFTDYMALIDSYGIDAVLVALTPSYKSKIDRNEGSIPTEFKAIYARYRADKEAYLQQTKSEDLGLYENFRQFGLLPVILNGAPKDVVPAVFTQENIKYWDISNTVVHQEKDGKLNAVGSTSRSFEELADHIVGELKNIAKQKDNEYQKKRAEVRAALFTNVKAGAHPVLEAQVFTETMTYRKVLDKESHFIVGRKGSGKSTLTEQLELQNRSRYARHIKIDFSRISLAFIYSYYTDRQFLSDTSSTRRYRSEYLELVWECFFVLCLIWDQRKQPKFSKWLNHKLKDRVDKYKPSEFFNVALSYAIEKFQAFQNAVIVESKDVLATLPARLSARRFLEFVIEKSLIQTIHQLVENELTLVTLDGIDSAFHDYRLEYMRFGEGDSTQYRQDRAKVEIDLIKALMRLISDIKAKKSEYPILATFHYCITIPLDLYQEIKEHHERDSYQFLTSCRPLDWTGPELALMLRKRVEKLTGVQIDKEKHYHPQERLLELFDECYPGLPKNIPVSIGNRTVYFPVFIYVLRHTFWRPREVIYQFLGLLSSFQYFRGDTPITETDVKAIVKDQTKALISSEFIDEFKSTLVNIQEIVDAFRSGPQYYSCPNFIDKLATVEFRFYLTPYDNILSNTNNKLRLLYEIGFIGLRLTDEQMATHSRPRNIFSFSEGMVIFDEIAREGINGARVCIHPAFIEYLNLSIDTDQEIALNIDWEYLRENEIRHNGSLQW
jgi:hypothetical protein